MKTITNFGKKEIDFTFGVQKRAMKIAWHLQETTMFQLKDDDFYKKLDYEVKTYPFYNGREKGICLIISPVTTSLECLFVVFGEGRNHDGTFVDIWEGDVPFNNPTIDDFSEEDYQKRQVFKYNDVEGVENYIHTKIKEYLTKFVEKN